MDFIALDFETATSASDSACAVGFACVENLQIVGRSYFLIKPPTLMFSKKNVAIHGIHPADVKGEPSFLELWDSIGRYFDGSCPIVAHNARFDMSVLKECLRRYNIPFPDFVYFCSIPFSTKICGGDVSRSLEARAGYFDIDIGQHHNAEADAVACARIVIETVNRSRQKSFSSFCNVHAIQFREFSELVPAKGIGRPEYDRIDYESAVVTQAVAGAGRFSGKTVVITGEFKDFSRRELAQIILNCGGVVKDSVSKKIDVLVVGTQDSALVGEDGLSSKQERALELIEKGAEIEILDENELTAILSNEGVMAT